MHFARKFARTGDFLAGRAAQIARCIEVDENPVGDCVDYNLDDIAWLQVAMDATQFLMHVTHVLRDLPYDVYDALQVVPSH